MANPLTATGLPKAGGAALAAPDCFHYQAYRAPLMRDRLENGP